MGVDTCFETYVEFRDILVDVDLIVVVDGIYSNVWDYFKEVLKSTVIVYFNCFVWLGIMRCFLVFIFYFWEDRAGLWCVYVYNYDFAYSIFIVECIEDIWCCFGLVDASEDEL